MGEFTWTKAQKEAIEALGDNILVSAAAGSGKTAVLVERVIRLITRQEDPCDIDSLVVMTFTKAAAAQMKSKIYQKLREELEKRPGDVYLRQQMMKVTNARICTIDSLCSQIVREHFQDIDLDPGFRMADDAQIALLRRQVLAEVIEEMYQEGSKEFLELADYYTDKNDKNLEQIVLTLYGYARSHPEPEAWLRGMVIPYRMAAAEYSDEEDLPYPQGMENWMEEFVRCVSVQMEKVRDMALAGLQISQMSFGPAPYEPVFEELLQIPGKMEGEPFDHQRQLIDECLEDWKSAPRITAAMGVDPDLKKAAMKYRDEIRKTLQDLQQRFFWEDLQIQYRQMGECLSVAQAMCSLTLRFGEELARVKKEKKLADFSDIAHGALRILISYHENGEIIRDEEGLPVYTEVADQMARGIREVIVDEYQDTNMLQEYLVMALSAQRFGRPDVFMVGDVKQSIYRFRMACPELFSGKMDRYGQGDGRLVILDSNFRSRKEILDLTNTVFEKTMLRETGGIDYRAGHALTYGGVYGPFEGPERDFLPEILMIQGSGDEGRSQEAYLIASKIEDLVAGGRYHFSDIVILTRASDNPQLEKVLYRRGIPIVKNTGKGFFDTFEIRLVLDLLKIIDNPLQDIPLAAVLHSPLCSATADDLAQIRLAGSKYDTLYDCLRKYQKHAKIGEEPERGEEVGCQEEPVCQEEPESDRDCHTEPECRDERETRDEREDVRFGWLLEKLDIWQEKAAFLGTRELLSFVLQDSGLDLIVSAMPQGADRRANLEFLKSLAQDYGEDLFSFLRYIQGLQAGGQDFGTLLASESVQAVRLMTIHHSKGLEFPVVILAAGGKLYNESDSRASILPDRSLGLGIESRDPSERILKKTILMETILEKQKRENRAEEMRLLYVAMTRAKEKLIITGSNRNLSSMIEKWDRSLLTGSSGVKPWEVMQANNYLALLGMALHPLKDRAEGFCLEYVEPEETMDIRAEELVRNALRQEQLLALAAEPADTEKLRVQLEFQYPYEKAATIDAKMTVSSIKMKSEEHEEAGDKAWPPAHQHTQHGQAGKLTGPERGTAYHDFLERYEYQGPDVEEQLRVMEEKGWLGHDACETIDPETIRTFLQSSVGVRMARAAAQGALNREQQFMIGYMVDVNSEVTLTGAKISSDVPDEELLLVQGRIDAWFIEDGSVILVDYKTDQVTEEEHYRLAYGKQLEQYAEVLRRCTAKPVKEKIIYSFELGREVLL